jgi:hypothetical protein
MTAMFRFWEIVERLRPHGFEIERSNPEPEEEPAERKIMRAPKEVDEDG